MFKKKYGLHFVSLDLKVNPYNVIIGKKERKGLCKPTASMYRKKCKFYSGK